MDVREAESGDLDAIFLMGYDAWSEGASVQVYLHNCRASKKYKLGKWYVLAHQGKLISSLIVYSSVFGIPTGYCGIGSVATEQRQRKNGYSSLLVSSVCSILEQEEVKGVYLYSDIGASLYERLGFSVLPGSKETCMVRMFGCASRLPDQVPHYF